MLKTIINIERQSGAVERAVKANDDDTVNIILRLFINYLNDCKFFNNDDDKKNVNNIALILEYFSIWSFLHSIPLHIHTNIVEAIKSDNILLL